MYFNPFNSYTSYNLRIRTLVILLIGCVMCALCESPKANPGQNNALSNQTKIIVKIKTAPYTNSVANEKSHSITTQSTINNAKTLDLFKTSSVKKNSSQILSSQAHQSKHSFEYKLIDTNKNDMDAVLNTLSHNPMVIYAEELITISAQAYNDPNYESQYYKHNLNLEGLSNNSESKIVVAVIDSGIDVEHEDLSAVIKINDQEILNGIDDDGNGVVDDIYGYNFYGYSEGNGTADISDSYGHGTHISGIIGAVGNNQKGIAGMSDVVSILPVSFLNSWGNGNQVDAARAIQYAVDMGADILNCSWGFSSESNLLKEAFEYAEANGVLVFAAAGNEGVERIEYPAGYESCIGVGSMDGFGFRSVFSSSGSHVDFMTYGESILSTVPGDDYDYQTGTSQATAVVTGMAATILGHAPDLTPTQVKEILINSTIIPSHAQKKLEYGFGILSPVLLVQQALQMEGAFIPSNLGAQTDKNNIVSVSNFPNPVSHASTTFELDSLADGTAEVVIYDLFGNKRKSINMQIFEGYNAIAWNCLDSSGDLLSSGTYLYVVKLIAQNKTDYSKGKLVILTE